MTADDGTGKYIMSRRGPGRGDGTDLARSDYDHRSVTEIWKVKITDR